jgi:hypothetical protein
MYCAYHNHATALVQCSSCNRGLCSACDHRIKGYPYCQDCIVAGIQSLQRGQQYYHYASPNPASGGNRKAFMAALCALLPGGGSIYNRQNFKAIIQFVGIIGLFRISRISPLQIMFLGGMLFYFQSILDAFRTARAVAQGESASANEEKFKQGLIRRAPMIGIGLIVAGLLVFIRMVQPLNTMLSFSRLAPVALIILGGYLLTRYFKNSRGVKPDYPERSSYPLLSGTFSNRHTQSANDSSRFGK